MFQYLLVNRNKVVLKERLHEVLWPDTERAAESSSLKVAVHALRRVLAGRDGRGADRLEVLYQDFGYILKVDAGVWIDFGEFEALTNAARGAESRGDLDGAARAYEHAVALYQGDFLLGESLDWVGEQREWLRGFALRALDFLSHHAIRRGDPAYALVCCRKSLEIDPCHEESYRTIMLVHAAHGDPGQVQRWYDLCTRRMREHLDAAPSVDTDRVLARALAGFDGSDAPGGLERIDKIDRLGGVGRDGRIGRTDETDLVNSFAGAFDGRMRARVLAAEVAAGVWA